MKFNNTIRKNKKFKDIYILKKDIKLDEVNFCDGEVMDCKYVTVDEFKKMIENDECIFKCYEDTIFSENN